MSRAPSVALIAWAGDVRVLRLRAERVTLLTREHPLINDYVSRGLVSPDDEKARALLPANVIVRALGMHAHAMSTPRTWPLKPRRMFSIFDPSGQWSSTAMGSDTKFVLVA